MAIAASTAMLSTMRIARSPALKTFAGTDRIHVNLRHDADLCQTYIFESFEATPPVTLATRS
jgi:hypothetical protein